MRTSLKFVQLWIPFIYAAALTGMALNGWSQSTVALPPGFPAYLAFLPMAFLFAAIGTHTHIARLERRIESLEARASPATTSAAG